MVDRIFCIEVDVAAAHKRAITFAETQCQKDTLLHLLHRQTKFSCVGKAFSPGYGLDMVPWECWRHEEEINPRALGGGYSFEAVMNEICERGVSKCLCDIKQLFLSRFSLRTVLLKGKSVRLLLLTKDLLDVNLDYDVRKATFFVAVEMWGTVWAGEIKEKAA